MFKSIQKKLKISDGENKNVLESLYEQPKKDKGKQIPHYKKGGAQPGYVYQADILVMPEDGRYKYLLVCVDTVTGKTEAVPLATKESEDTANGFRQMFSKGVLAPPKFSIEVDSGTEFKGATKKYFDDMGVLVRYGKTGRSRQQAMAENRNRILGKALFQKQVGQELLTGKQSKSWVDDVQTVLDAINEHEEKQYKTEMQRKAQREKNKVITPNLQPSVPILEVGTKVRVKLDKPMGVLGEKLAGNFRATDIKWDPKIKEITNIILTPEQPVMYQVDKETTGYTRNQLQVVSEKEQPVNKELIKTPEAEMPDAMKAQQKELEKAMPVAMEHALEKVECRPKKIKSTQSYQPVPIATIEPKMLRSGREVKAKKIFDL